MGSRRWKTNHILSDIDAAIITDSTNYEIILFYLQKYYTEHYKNIEYRTKTIMDNLFLFKLKNFTDKGIGAIQIDYTIQSPEKNKIVLKKTQKALDLKFETTDERTRYALQIMEAVCEDSLEKQLKIKKWMHTLFEE